MVLWNVSVLADYGDWSNNWLTIARKPCLCRTSRRSGCWNRWRNLHSLHDENKNLVDLCDPHSFTSPIRYNWNDFTSDDWIRWHPLNRTKDARTKCWTEAPDGPFRTLVTVLAGAAVNMVVRCEKWGLVDTSGDQFGRQSSYWNPFGNSSRGSRSVWW